MILFLVDILFFFILDYANGTDNFIDIYNYNNIYLNNNDNLVSYLTESVTIDNNIFGYEIITDQINLVFIPDHLIFHNLKGEQSEQVMNGILEKNYTLEIRETTINNNYLEYQIMLIEADFI